MNLRKFVVLLLCMFGIISAQAQDKLFKKNGRVINVKILSVNESEIAYKKTNNPYGPDQYIAKTSVEKIRYANGKEEVFDDNTDGRQLVRKDNPEWMGKATKNGADGNNGIIYFSPIVVTNNGYGTGFGVEYPIDKAGTIRFNLPVIASITSDTYNQYSGSMFYMTPGIKFYTNLHSRHRMKFSLGPSMVMGMGSGNYNLTPYSPYDKKNNPQFVYGAMFNIGFNFFPTAHLFLGLDYGIGLTSVHSDNYVELDGISHLAFKVGYRFATHAIEKMAPKTEIDNREN